MRISLGTDHAGFELKEAVASLCTSLGHEVIDFGCHSSESCDYPDFVLPAARAVASGDTDRAIVFGGSGNGEAIAANKVAGIRCALCWNTATAQLAREHNDANALSLGARQVDEALALEIVRTWLATDFDGGRHLRRIQKLPN
jgi:ribose 5-phosphate isomerase B